MFYFPQSFSEDFILYPGSGIDFTPLLSETQLSHDLPAFMEALRATWSLSTLLLCDNSSVVISFFQNLREGSIFYDQTDRIYKGESAYFQAWEESPLERLSVHSVKHSMRHMGSQKQFEAYKLTLEAVVNGNTAYAKAEFLACDFHDLADAIEEELHRERMFSQINISGMFLIGMPNGREFIRPAIFPNARFIVSDLPPKFFKEQFLPVHIRLRHIGRKRRSYASGLGAAIFLNHKEFAEIQLPDSKSFWLIPGLFAASDCSNESERSEEPIKKSNYVLIETGEDALDEDNLISLLNQIDEVIERNHYVLLREYQRTERLLLVLGAWLIRHGVASGPQVLDHIRIAASLAGHTIEEFATVDSSAEPREMELLSQWVIGQ